MIYVDMDGVLADFDDGIMRMYGKPMESMSQEEMEDFWGSACIKRSFFLSLSGILGGIRLMDHLRLYEHPYCILTSTGGGSRHMEIARDKLQWLMRYESLRSAPVAFCTGTKSKAEFASPGSLLIDDRPKVVDAFIAGGGSAFLFEPERFQDAVSKCRDWCFRC